MDERKGVGSKKAGNQESFTNTDADEETPEAGENILAKDQGLAKLQALRKYGWYASSLLDEVELKIHSIGS